jgi:alpha-L-arabinofuranosidase
VFSSHQAERAVRICAALIERVRAAQRIAHPIHIAFDEWNVWWRTRSHEDRVGGVEERYTLTDALAVATYLNGFIRHCDTVKIANLAQLVNAIAPIFTSAKGLFLQTIYHPLQLYAEHTREIGLDVHVSGETYALSPAQETESEGRVHHVAELGPFTLLDAAATCDAAGRQVTLAVVNRDAGRAHRATIDLGGAAAAGNLAIAEVNGPDVRAMNTFEQPRVVEAVERTGTAKGPRFEYDFPAHSVTVLRFAVTP